MGTRFGLICVAAVVMLCGAVGTADAQVVSFSGSGYVPANLPAQPTIAPYGTFSVPANKAGK